MFTLVTSLKHYVAGNSPDSQPTKSKLGSDVTKGYQYSPDPPTATVQGAIEDMYSLVHEKDAFHITTLVYTLAS
jgi:hypothetical protein